LFDVTTDPGERHNLLRSQPEMAKRLQGVLSLWRDGQLAYYHFPQYYLVSYPPDPPRLQAPAQSAASR
jgi:hypothetical protein